MTTTLNGQIIGEAERTTRAVLDRLLDRTGTDFHGWVALNVIAAGGDQATRSAAVSQLTRGLRIDEAVAQSTVDGLVATGLLEGDLMLTEAGSRRHAEIRQGIADITARVYGDLPADDLQVAARVLTTITARAQAELATSV
jgi:hypothetical protein